MGLLPFAGAPGKMKIGNPVVSGTSKSILFVDSSGNLAQNNAGFNWDNAAAIMSITGQIILSNNSNGYALYNTSAQAVKVAILNSNNDLHFLPNLGEASFLNNGTYFGFNAPINFTFGAACCGGFGPISFTFNSTDHNAFQINNTTMLLVTSSGQVQIGNGQQTSFNSSGVIEKYNNITTAGLGHAAIYGSYSTTGNTGAVTNAINYTPPATAGRYRLTGVVDVTAWTTPASFTVVAVYKDDSGTTRTETLAVTRGSTGVVAAAVTTVDRYYFSLPLFAINNAATAITLSTTGTFTGTPVYNLSAVLEQLA